MKLTDDADPRPFYQTPREDADALREAFLQLLAQDLPEQSYQRFIEEHTQLVPHEFVQNHVT